MNTTTYTVHMYADGSAIGEISLSDAEFAEYLRESQQPEGLISLSDLIACCGRSGEYIPSDVVPMGTTVYVEE